MFGDVKMFGRVAACCITVFVLISPAASSGETNAFATVDAPATADAIAPTDDQAQVLGPVQAPERIEERSRDGNQARTNGAQEPIKEAALDPVEPVIALPASPASIVAPHAVLEPFGLNAVPLSSGALLTKWSGVEAEIHAENDTLARCRDDAAACPSAARNFLAIVAAGRAQTGRARIGVINRAINLAISPMSDLAQWGVIDRWSAPLDTLTTGRGDCEDYAIAKYVALSAAGVSTDDVKLVIVRNTAVAEDHAVVAVRLDGSWIMLDNRWLTLVEDDEMPGVVPLFVLDDNGVRQFAPASMPSLRRAAMPGAAPASL
jgi:predicted transglutaminase-like cysteine proteinase